MYGYYGNNEEFNKMLEFLYNRHQITIKFTVYRPIDLSQDSNELNSTSTIIDVVQYVISIIYLVWVAENKNNKTSEDANFSI